MKEKFLKLKEQNNWGDHYYEKVAEIKKYEKLKEEKREKSFADYLNYKENLRLVFEEGQEVNVKWPNEEITRENISLKHYTENINDMGHSYKVDGKVPIIKISIRGLESVVSDFEKLQFANSDLKYQNKPSFIK
jgi:hypothetical protein